MLLRLNPECAIYAALHNENIREAGEFRVIMLQCSISGACLRGIRAYAVLS